MKSISDALQTHLAGSVTSICTCWKITRADGEVFAFTDHDQNLVIEDVTYLASTGYTRSAISSDLTMKVDNLDIDGLLDSGSITEEDIKAGRYDFAEIEIFLVNWADLSMGQLNLRAGWFGEVVTLPTGVFHTEIRGLNNALLMNVGQYYTPICRADLGDTKCKIPIAPPPWAADTAVTVGYYVSDPEASDDAHALAIYECTVAGTTASSQPTFNDTVNAVTTETTGVHWTSRKSFRGVGLVVSSSSNSAAVVSGMVPVASLDGTLATVAMASSTYQNMGIVLTIGTNTQTFTLPFGVNTTYMVEALVSDINNAGMGATASEVFTLSNLHAVNIQITTPNTTGNVSKIDDPNNAMEISNFDGAGGSGSPYFQGGIVTWVTGANAGMSMEIKSWTATSGDQGNLQLFLSMPFPMQVGDKFYWAPGCDKTRSTCFYRFNNMNNFRGEPDLPGIDALLQTGSTV